MWCDQHIQSTNPGKGQAHLDYILTKHTNRRLICYVHHLSPFSESLESDHNQCRIRNSPCPRQFYCKHESTKVTRRTTSPQRLIVYPELRSQVARVMSAELPLVLNKTCISDIAAGMADVILYIFTKMVLRWRMAKKGYVQCFFTKNGGPADNVVVVVSHI